MYVLVLVSVGGPEVICIKLSQCKRLVSLLAELGFSFYFYFWLNKLKDRRVG